MGLDKAVDGFGESLDKAIDDPAKRVGVAVAVGAGMAFLFVRSSGGSLHDWALRHQLVVPPDEADVRFGQVGLDWTQVVLLGALGAFVVLMVMMGLAMRRTAKQK